MNTKNNKRKRQSKIKIENALVELLQTKEIKDISVTDICRLARLNRSTFYANYLDIYDLTDKIRERMLADFHELYAAEALHGYNSNDYLKLFYHIKENQLFYKTYFKLGFDAQFEITRYDTNYAEKYYNNKHLDYHMEFFRAGITAVIKLWLENDCRISPEEVFGIIKSEYAEKQS